MTIMTMLCQHDYLLTCRLSALPPDDARGRCGAWVEEQAWCVQAWPGSRSATGIRGVVGLRGMSAADAERGGQAEAVHGVRQYASLRYWQGSPRTRTSFLSASLISLYYPLTLMPLPPQSSPPHWSTTALVHTHIGNVVTSHMRNHTFHCCLRHDSQSRTNRKS